MECMEEIIGELESRVTTEMNEKVTAPCTKFKLN